MPSETILVIDATVSVTTTLTDGGYRVVTATGGEAVEKAASEHPRLVVVNAASSASDGHRVCRQVKATLGERNVRVLMLTGRPSLTETFWGMKNGADAYLAEPFVRDRLVYDVNRLI
jgi:twitching motility two-component system response regulator PilH